MIFMNIRPFDIRFISDEDFLWAILVMLLLVIIANGNRGTAEKVTLAIKLRVCPSYSIRLHSFPTSNIIIIIFTTFQYFFLYFQYFTVFFSVLLIPTACIAFRPLISSSLLAVSLAIKSAMIFQKSLNTVL